MSTARFMSPQAVSNRLLRGARRRLVLWSPDWMFGGGDLDDDRFNPFFITAQPSQRAGLQPDVSLLNTRSGAARQAEPHEGGLRLFLGAIEQEAVEAIS